MWAIYRNNTFAGVAFSSYGAFWLGYGIYGILASVSHSSSPRPAAPGRPSTA